RAASSPARATAGPGPGKPGQGLPPAAWPPPSHPWGQWYGRGTGESRGRYSWPRPSRAAGPWPAARDGRRSGRGAGAPGRRGDVRRAGGQEVRLELAEDGAGVGAGDERAVAPQPAAGDGAPRGDRLREARGQLGRGEVDVHRAGVEVDADHVAVAQGGDRPPGGGLRGDVADGPALAGAGE